MNWLAHLRLAPNVPLLRLGNLCGDFVRGVDLSELHPELQKGVLQHRAVDAFVDAHPVVQRSRLRLASSYRRLSGVLIDVFYDHFLARDWQQLGDGRPLRSFVDEVHDLLHQHSELLPERLQGALPVMRREDWLASYGRVEGIDSILARMSGRMRRTTTLADGGSELRAHYQELGADFAEVWPQLVTEALHLHDQ